MGLTVILIHMLGYLGKLCIWSVAPEPVGQTYAMDEEQPSMFVISWAIDYTHYFIGFIRESIPRRRRRRRRRRRHGHHGHHGAIGTPAQD